MRRAERRKVNVLDMKCLRSLVGVSRMDGVRNERSVGEQGQKWSCPVAQSRGSESIKMV